ncbi:MAG TPA: NADH-quinone oxidoreductase subunit A [Pyrinomonadaceae bacterium]|nr:NADH-quinone oxidoreductase subunit A [Pyrinomonadaceae bacterium]
MPLAAHDWFSTKTSPPADGGVREMTFRLYDYLPILLMFVVAGGFAVGNVLLSQFVGQRKRTRTKLMPYECGKDPVGSARERFSVKFYLIAMIFILFDIEVIFLVPWAAVFKSMAAQGPAMRWFVYLEMMVFVGLLLVGYIYVVKKGAFDWGEKARREAEAEARALHEMEDRQLQRRRPAA